MIFLSVTRKAPRKTGKRLALFIIPLVFTACLSGVRAEKYKVKIVILPGIDLSAGEIGSHLPGITMASDSAAGEIAVYYFSEGIERYSYSDNGKMVHTTAQGTMKAMVKLRRRGRLNRVFFVSSSGASREEIIVNCAGKIRKILKR